jgi:hypothetical protein
MVAGMAEAETVAAGTVTVVAAVATTSGPAMLLVGSAAC